MTRVSIEGLVSEIRARAQTDNRFIVALAGPPGAGKSTLAAKLALELGETAAVVPMDGFHLENDVLDARGLRDRKGAPETFDAEGFGALLRRIRTAATVSYPTFDRALDRTVPDGAQLASEAKIILAEGNYLLLNEEPWNTLKPAFDLTVMIDVPIDVLEARLIQRWIDHGLSVADATARARENDLRNAQRVLENSAKPDFTIA